MHAIMPTCRGKRGVVLTNNTQRREEYLIDDHCIADTPKSPAMIIFHTDGEKPRPSSAQAASIRPIKQRAHELCGTRLHVVMLPIPASPLSPPRPFCFSLPTQSSPSFLPLTSSTLYQQGCPRRVMEPSMMSSATRKKACSCRSEQWKKTQFAWYYGIPNKKMWLLVAPARWHAKRPLSLLQDTHPFDAPPKRISLEDIVSGRLL